MEELKNICGRIPLDLHERVRQEIEDTESSIPKFLQMVIEEHFTRKGEIGMDAKKTIAVQVTEELFNRFKKVVEWKKCKQKDFLIDLLGQSKKQSKKCGRNPMKRNRRRKIRRNHRIPKQRNDTDG